MEAFVLNPILEAADRLRSATLRITLSGEWLRAIFKDRAARLLFLFLLTAAFNLTLAVFFPLWVLLVGPILYGVPHLFASVRYSHASMVGSMGGSSNDALLTRQGLFRLALFCWAGVMGFRLLSDVMLVPWVSSFSGWPETVSLVVTFLGCLFLYRTHWVRAVRSAMFILPLVFFAWRAPIELTGVLILLHNWVAFAFWFRAAKSRREKWGVLIATGLFALANVAIFLGVFDGAYRFFTPDAAIPFAGLDYSDLGQAIAPHSDHYVVWFHCVVAYAFGQATHYFVWMKAIPEQYLDQEAPTSFRQSYRLLREDFGTVLFGFAGAATLAAMGAWALVAMPVARALYFAAAAYHSYLELAVLPLAFFSRNRS